jgi:hypothetical protein
MKSNQQTGYGSNRKKNEMDIQLQGKESIRVKTYSGPFIDIRHIDYESLAVDLYAFQGYIELRQKDRQFRLFQFPKKSYKKDHDFGWWKDAEVIFSYNENGKDK